MRCFFLLFLSIFILSCGTLPENVRFDSEIHGGDATDVLSINTQSKKIRRQKKITYFFPKPGVYISNKFPGAGLAKVEQTGTYEFKAFIEMENYPINDSPWYAFKIWSKSKLDQKIIVHLVYPNKDQDNKGSHRYPPKLSSDGSHWNSIAKEDYDPMPKFPHQAKFRIKLSTSPILVSAQEVLPSQDIIRWSKQIALTKDYIYYSEIKGLKSGRIIPKIEFRTSSKAKPSIVILGRQHPPEVTGSLALKEFVEILTTDSAESFRLRKSYNIVIYPLVNPDGVDLGHWRHNTGGVDLNRDWGLFRQPETKLIAQDVKTYGKSGIPFMIDFHSTFHDVIYILEPSYRPEENDLALKWIRLHAENLKQRELYVKMVAHNVYYSTSLYWFYDNFKSQGVVYEVGDNTPRDELKTVAKSAAYSLFELFSSEKK